MKTRNFARLIGVATAAAVSVALLGVGAASEVPTLQAAEEPQGQIPLTGAVSVHDPTMFFDESTQRYVVASTHNSIRSAPTMNGPWTTHGNVSKAPWTFAVSPGTLWAPHVTRIDDTYYYFYSQSNFGSNNSAIGLKTTQTPTIPSSYVDHGEPIIVSGLQIPGYDPEDDSFPQYNAIDPAVYQDDENGDWWIVWGSHFSGIWMQRLADDMVTVLGEPELVSDRGSNDFPLQEDPRGPFAATPNRIEGPSIFSRDGYYYFMSGWDRCCVGGNSTYKVVIGRSENINGPYVDKHGVPLTEGGGSIILNSRVASPGVTPTGLYRAPGGPDYFIEDGVYYLIYHAYRPFNTLGIWPMNWHDGWPYLNDPGGGPYDLQDRAYFRLVNQAGNIHFNPSLHNPVASDRCLTATVEDGQPNVVQTDCDDSLEQVWELQREFDGFWRFRSMIAHNGHCLTMSDDSGEIGTNVVVAPCDGDESLQEWALDDTGHGFHRLVINSTYDGHLPLAVEIENECDPPMSYNCDGVLGTNVFGGVRRDGAHTPTNNPIGDRDHAGKWPPQQWQLSREPISTELLLAAFNGFAADGRVMGSGPAASGPPRLNAFRNMLVDAVALIEAGENEAAHAELEELQAKIHVSGSLHMSHFVTGDDAGTLHDLIEQLKEAIG